MSKQDLINRARLKVRGKLTPQIKLTDKTFAVLDLEAVVIDEGTEKEHTFFATTIQFNGEEPAKYAVGGALVIEMLEELEAGKEDLPVWASQSTVRTRKGKDAYVWELHSDAEAAAILKKAKKA